VAEVGQQMPEAMTDARSHGPEQIARAAELLALSEHRIKVFDAVYRGKRAIKTRAEIEAATGLDNKQVLTAGKKLADNHLVVADKVDGQVAYRKDPYLKSHKQQILNLARSPKRLEKAPRNSATRRGASMTTVKIELSAPSSYKPPRAITIDDIDSFKGVRGVVSTTNRVEMSEATVKEGVTSILGEEGEFKDWGGETNDVYTTRIEVSGKRRQAAFALKGPAQKGKLTPAKMGVNGDQAQRLFSATADVYVVQYVGQIAESVVELVHLLAIARAVASGRQVFYCVIDGQDTDRLIKAYPEDFSE
jgi:hypothetical protein